MLHITHYTSVTDEKDLPTVENVFTDIFKDPRRNSRLSKICPHLYFNTEYSIYTDGNIRLLKPLEFYIEKYLKHHDIAVYKHPQRDCLYDEAMVCAKRGLDDPEKIIEQAKAYEDDGYGKHKGLAECGVIFRRHTAKVKQLNECWWAHYCRYSRRDQISFMKAVDEVGIRVNLIDDLFIEDSPVHAIKQSGEVDIIIHTHFR